MHRYYGVTSPMMALFSVFSTIVVFFEATNILV